MILVSIADTDSKSYSSFYKAPYLKFKWQQRDSNPQFTQKLVRNIITIYSQMHRLDKYSQHSSIIKKN